MKVAKNKNVIRRQRRQSRIRAVVSGTTERPRLSVFKSNRYLYVQLIDDSKGTTLGNASTKGMKGKTMTLRAEELGKKIAEVAKTKKVSKVVFDRGGYLYTGKIKAIADGARSGGLEF